MNILKAIIKGTFTIIILGLITMKSLEWALYFFVAKPVAKEIAYDVTSYVEVNDRYFTEESLNEYLDAYRKKDLNIKVLYNQHPDDKRFIVKVDVQANWDSIYSPTAYFHTRSINLGDPPPRSIFARFDNQTEISKKTNVQASKDEDKQIDIPAVAITNKTEAPRPSITDQDIETLIENYVTLGMEAIRDKDFSYIEPLLDPQGKIYNESQGAIQTINEKGLEEEVVTVQVQNINHNSSTDITVKTYEEFIIAYPNGSKKLKGYNSSYRVRVTEQNRPLINETIYVEEVSSEVWSAPSEQASREIIKGACVSCHGGSLEGGVGPKLTDIGSRMTKEEIHTILMNGKGIMPKGLVKTEEAELLADYLVELEH
ncbi:c-type cytochrome [Bacillus sp. KH172YL63]|uniref:c-type cytochrome n=1 Tax=Bacillus sp. KH172YL63 TaxID=2709784 RepID=UPI0013E4E8F2|nr:cytochrome c [Bacillus sp. KH172YL63]BCB05806.1 hypothetical protein KH172YL63_39390 [Bacillus sp. KH172YL63]